MDGNVIEYFLGHTAEYWLLLEKAASERDPNVNELLVEVLQLRGKISFYEARIKQMADVMGHL